MARAPLAAGLAIPCLFYLLAGLGLRRVEDQAAPSRWIALPLILGPAVVIALGWNRAMDITSGNFGTPVLGAVLTISIVAGLLLMDRALGRQ